MHRHGGIAQHRFGTGRGDHDEAFALGEWIAQVPQIAVLFRSGHLEVRQRRLQHRVPVHQALAAVDEAFVVEPDEHLGDRSRQTRIHREAVAGPVDRCAEPAHLLCDGAAGFLFPSPHALDEGFAPQLGAGLARGVQLTLDHHLGGDAGVIRARLPQRVEAAHPVIADERIHDRVLKRVPHMQRAGDVGGRDDDGVGRGPTARREITGTVPESVDARFDCAGGIGFIHVDRL